MVPCKTASDLSTVIKLEWHGLSCIDAAMASGHPIVKIKDCMHLTGL